MYIHFTVAASLSEILCVYENLSNDLRQCLLYLYWLFLPIHCSKILWLHEYTCVNSRGINFCAQPKKQFVFFSTYHKMIVKIKLLNRME